MNCLASSGWRHPATRPTASSMTGVPLFGKTYCSGEPRWRSRSVSGRSQIVMSPSPRMIFSYRRIGLKTYSFVWASRRASQAKPRRGGAGLADGFREDVSPHRSHRARGERIADQDLALPLRVEKVVPLARRLGGRDGLRVVDGHGRRPVEAEVQVARHAGCLPRWRRPTPAGTARAIPLRRRARRSCRDRRTRRRPADSTSRSATGRRPPASPCRASGRRPPDGPARTLARRGRAGRGRAGSRGRGACAGRDGSPGSPRPRQSERGRGLERGSRAIAWRRRC